MLLNLVKVHKNPKAALSDEVTNYVSDAKDPTSSVLSAFKIAVEFTKFPKLWTGKFNAVEAREILLWLERAEQEINEKQLLEHFGTLGYLFFSMLQLN